jgi:hypothetical protein
MYLRSVVENATPAVLEMTFSQTLANQVPAPSAFTVKVNLLTRGVGTVTVSGTKVFLTLSSPVIFGDIITVAYAKPSDNPLQSASGIQIPVFDNRSVSNNCQPVAENIPPVISIVTPVKSSVFEALANIPIEANAYDSDGTVTKVEFYSGNVKIGEDFTEPFTFVWKNVNPGTFQLTAVATDDKNSTFTSNPVEVIVNVANSEKFNGRSVKEIIVYPNPNNGQFTLEIPVSENEGTKRLSVTGFSGKVMYNEILQPDVAVKQMDLSFLSHGIYIMIIEENKNIIAAGKLCKK